jgi:hypothetical protein
MTRRSLWAFSADCLACLRGRGTKIFHHEDTHCTGPPAGVVKGFDPADELAQILALTLAALVQRVPEFWLQTHAGSSAVTGDDIASDQPAARHGRPPAYSGRRGMRAP